MGRSRRRTTPRARPARSSSDDPGHTIKICENVRSLMSNSDERVWEAQEGRRSRAATAAVRAPTFGARVVRGDRARRTRRVGWAALHVRGLLRSMTIMKATRCTGLCVSKSKRRLVRRRANHTIWLARRPTWSFLTRARRTPLRARHGPAPPRCDDDGPDRRGIGRAITVRRPAWSDGGASAGPPTTAGENLAVTATTRALRRGESS